MNTNIKETKTERIFPMLVVWLLLASILVFAASVIAMSAYSARLKEELVTTTKDRDVWRDSAIYWQNKYEETLVEKETEPVFLGQEASLILLAAGSQVKEAPWNDAGEFRITFYCPCSKCCGKYANGLTATGTAATEGRTVAVDPKVIPLGSEVLIDGEVYIAEDTGVSGHAVDIFLNEHHHCIEKGLYYTTVKWRQTGE